MALSKDDVIKLVNEFIQVLRQSRSTVTPSSMSIESLRVVFLAACGEFVIPAEAGIQKTGLDSASSAE